MPKSELHTRSGQLSLPALAVLALAPHSAVSTDGSTPAVLAVAPDAVMRADARAPAVLAPVPLAVMLTLLSPPAVRLPAAAVARSLPKLTLPPPVPPSRHVTFRLLRTALAALAQLSCRARSVPGHPLQPPLAPPPHRLPQPPRRSGAARGRAAPSGQRQRRARRLTLGALRQAAHARGHAVRIRAQAMMLAARTARLGRQGMRGGWGPRLSWREAGSGPAAGAALA